MGLTWNGNGRGEATDWLRLLPLAAGTLLLLLGLFSAWQTWLIADEGHANDRVHQAQEQAVQQVGAELDRQRAMIRTVLDRIDPALVASDPRRGRGGSEERAAAGAARAVLQRRHGRGAARQLSRVRLCQGRATDGGAECGRAAAGPDGQRGRRPSPVVRDADGQHDPAVGVGVGGVAVCAGGEDLQRDLAREWPHRPAAG